MKIQIKSPAVALAALTCFLGGSVFGAEAAKPDLQAIAQGIGAKAGARTTVRWETGVKGRDALFSSGVVWLDGVNFTDGTIECDILGRSAPRGSNFLGLAFRGADDVTYDCVYFRPFNFRAPSPESSNHAVQYISHPQWTWSKLRAERTGRYEKPLVPPPDGDQWFHARIVIVGKRVRVFVDDAEKPALEVEMLHARARGRIGIWGGDAGVGGHFANLKITPATGEAPRPL